MEPEEPHPGLNPAYYDQMEKRLEAQAHNRRAKAHNLLMRAIDPKAFGPLKSVPKQPNKYVPHYGAKEAAKYAGRVVL